MESGNVLFGSMCVVFGAALPAGWAVDLFLLDPIRLNPRYPGDRLAQYVSGPQTWIAYSGFATCSASGVAMLLGASLWLMALAMSALFVVGLIAPALLEKTRLSDDAWRARQRTVERPTVRARVLDDNERDGALIRQPNGDVQLYVRCPSKGDLHVIMVPPHMRTAHQARAWTFGLEAKDFSPVKET